MSKHDTAHGPCACGAWHSDEELWGRISFLETELADTRKRLMEMEQVWEGTGRDRDKAHAAIREVPRICSCGWRSGICGFCLWREKHAPAIARASEASIARASQALSGQGTAGQGQGK